MWDRATIVLRAQVEKMTPAETVIYAILVYLLGVASGLLVLIVFAVVFEPEGFVEYMTDRGLFLLHTLSAFAGMMAYHSYAAAREAQATGCQLRDVKSTGPTFFQFGAFAGVGSLSLYWLIENTGLSANPLGVDIVLAPIGGVALTAMYVVYRTRWSSKGDGENHESPAPSMH